MTDQLAADLNSTIAEAVKARVEAEVFAALSGDETIASFVVAALQQPVEVETRPYHKEKVPYLRSMLQKAIQEITRDAVKRVVLESTPEIEEEIRKALRRDIRRIAETLTKSLSDAAEKGYGFRVDLTMNVPS